MIYKLISILIIVIGFLNCIGSGKKEVLISDDTIPMIHRKHVYIQGEVRGKQGNFVFDTGATGLYFDSIYYAESDFNFKKLFKGVLPGAGVSRQFVKVIGENVDFQFGDHHYNTTNIPIFHLKPILGDFADGILGLKYFENSVLEFNYDNEFIKVHENLISVNLKDWTKISLTRNGNRLYIPSEVLVNDSIKVSGDYLLDLGSGGTVILTTAIAEKYNLNEEVKDKTLFYTNYGGVGGKSSSNLFRGDIKIGDFSFDQITMRYSNDIAGAMSSREYLGVVGIGLLERFNLYIDFINNDLYLKPNKNYDDSFNVPRLGLSYVDRAQTLKSWVVSGLYESSNAEKSGLKIDDRILSVNGKNVSDLDYQLQQSFFKELDEIKIEVERSGKMIKIAFKLQPVL